MPTAEPSTVSHARSAIQQQQQQDWLENLARLGYASRGAIYLIIGGLAVLSAFGEGGKVTDSKGALSKVLESPGGWLIVLALAVGLVGYSIWRFCQVVYDPDHHGTDAKGIAVRAGMAVSGATHVLLAGWAAKVALGYATGSSGGSDGKESLVRMLMSQPFGQWLVGGLGVILVGVGVAHFLKGYKKKFEKYFTWSHDKRKVLQPICQAGLYARGVLRR
ncbi:hypothetical protein Pla123a_37540 [Posidoniimonas polymericola]|uniref:DUF1206 domain-containing protein n=1 Tax=Posidoniimonas polymericola TaxID=2528002 RepID=A0A5C5YER5_9BACT|nr:DUF1206 domain-containing protein [Posidoniimonas polymericola]TWT73419.1 hypothetical protein Pla123a_37540 [Posidoniimonas polymericola]